MSAEDKSSTFSRGDSTTVVTGLVESPSPANTSAARTDQESRPVASTLEPAPALAPQSVDAGSDQGLAGSPLESFWGLTFRDCLLLFVLAIVCLGLSVWHWGQLSGWGLKPVEIDRLPERIYDYRIDINEATWVEWMQLPAVGPTLAKRIIEHRETNGPFQSVDELDDIRGIGPKTIEKLRPWLIVREQEPKQQQSGSPRDP